jgi:hypothetical protein
MGKDEVVRRYEKGRSGRGGKEEGQREEKRRCA